MKRITILLLTAFIFIMACSKKSSYSNTTSSTVPHIYKKIYGASDMYVEGNYVVIKTKDLPDHKALTTKAHNGRVRSMKPTTEATAVIFPTMFPFSNKISHSKFQ